MPYSRLSDPSIPGTMRKANLLETRHPTKTLSEPLRPLGGFRDARGWSLLAVMVITSFPGSTWFKSLFGAAKNYLEVVLVDCGPFSFQICSGAILSRVR